MVVFPNCKINLGLRVLRRRADGFHDLQTVFYPLPLHDALEIVRDPSPTDGVRLSLSGLAVAGPADKNICVQAWQLLKSDFPQLPPISMHLHKAIPSGAGLGGGSSDGAATLLLLNRKFGLNLSEETLLGYALRLGSDCPFFIRNQPCLAGGRGEKMEAVDLDLSAYRIVVVHPAIGVNTGWAFSRIRPAGEAPDLRRLISLPVEEWKDRLVNDFEAVVFEAHPEVKAIKEELYRAGALFASMSGSGSTVYGIFEKDTIPSWQFPEHYFVK